MKDFMNRVLFILKSLWDEYKEALYLMLFFIFLIGIVIFAFREIDGNYKELRKGINEYYQEREQYVGSELYYDGDTLDIVYYDRESRKYLMSNNMYMDEKLVFYLIKKDSINNR